MRKNLSILFSFLTSIGFATDVLSVGIRTHFKYADMDMQCSLPGMARNFVLSAEVNSGKVTKAKLRKTHLDTYSEVLELEGNELDSIQISEKQARLWIKKWEVSGRVLDLLMRGGKDQGYDTCYPPHALSTIDPESFLFDFPAHSSTALPYSDSNTGVFKGLTEKGNPYRIELQLIQDRI